MTTALFRPVRRFVVIVSIRVDEESGDLDALFCSALEVHHYAYRCCCTREPYMGTVEDRLRCACPARVAVGCAY